MTLINKKARMAKWRRKEKVPFEELKVHECPNCGHEFKGYYCPNCGQSDTEFDRPAGFVFYDFLGNFFAFDSRFLLTFRDLMVRPGFLTNEFFRGRRARYAPPFRVYIFVSFVLFLLLQVMTNSALDHSYDKTKNNEQGVAIADSVLKSNIDSLRTVTGAKADSARTDINLGSILSAENPNGSMEAIANQLDQQLGKTTDASKRKRILELQNMLRSPQQLVSKVFKYLSWAFFILLPLFALLLKLFYVRRHIFYVRHLIFSIHIHSFLFFVLILIVALNLIFSTGVAQLSFWLLVLVPVYIYLAFRNFYKQGYLKTFFKFILIGAVYNLVVISTVVYVFIHALNIA